MVAVPVRSSPHQWRWKYLLEFILGLGFRVGEIGSLGFRVGEIESLGFRVIRVYELSGPNSPRPNFAICVVISSNYKSKQLG